MQIYRECDESWRLTLNGDLNIPLGRTEEFCEGPCFSETHLALNCIEEIIHHYRFFNRATIHDIRETLKSGCSYGPERGLRFLKTGSCSGLYRLFASLFNVSLYNCMQVFSTSWSILKMKKKMQVRR